MNVSSTKLKFTILGVFTVGMVFGLYLAAVDAPPVSDATATSEKVSPTKARERDTYYPNSEDLAKDEMRVIACGTGMPTTCTPTTSARSMTFTSAGQSWAGTSPYAYGALAALFPNSAPSMQWMACSRC